MTSRRCWNDARDAVWRNKAQDGQDEQHGDANRNNLSGLLPVLASFRHAHPPPIHSSRHEDARLNPADHAPNRVLSLVPVLKYQTASPASSGKHHSVPVTVRRCQARWVCLPRPPDSQTPGCTPRPAAVSKSLLLRHKAREGSQGIQEHRARPQGTCLPPSSARTARSSIDPSAPRSKQHLHHFVPFSVNFQDVDLYKS